jgi:hypothetical protein
MILFFFILFSSVFPEKNDSRNMKEMRGMGACVMLAMGMGCLLPQTGSFAVPSQSLLLRSRGGARSRAQGFF